MARYALVMAESELTPAEYEDLTLRLIGLLSDRMGRLTSRLERGAVLPGLATGNQIDVVWEGPIADQMHRLVFECRRYKSRIDQGRLHAFRSVVDDIGGDMPTTGVMVTTTGYQAGSRRIADTYGLQILELREPAPADVDGRILRIEIAITARVPLVRHFTSEVIEPLRDFSDLVSIDRVSIDRGNGAESISELLLSGETSPAGQPPTPLHPVVRRFSEPATLLIDGVPTARVSSVGALVGDSDSAFSIEIGPGAEGVAWVVKNALDGASVWFARDGTIYEIGDPLLGISEATSPPPAAT